MAEFSVGDRVRVRAGARTPYGGRAGTVVGVSPDVDGGSVFDYQVHLDVAPVVPNAPDCVPFFVDELEPETPNPA